MTDGAAPEKKSPLVGELLAFFPGFFVHGMGHRYAGNDEKADEILAMELWSFLPVGLGAALYGIGRSEDAEAVEIAGLVGMGVGAVPFLGTWIYDLVFTPSEVNRYNSRLPPSVMISFSVFLLRMENRPRGVTEPPG